MFSFITHTTVLCLILLNKKNPFEFIFIGFVFLSRWEPDCIN